MKMVTKVTKSEIFIVALAAVFLAALGLMYQREMAVAAGADYTITTQRQAKEPVTPERKEPAEPVKVNINTAGAEELQTLTGIGPVLAERIIAYREEHGPFRSVEDLLEVKGIGEATLEKLRDDVTVETPEGPAEEDE